jgi:hypothetical protein
MFKVMYRRNPSISHDFLAGDKSWNLFEHCEISVESGPLFFHSGVSSISRQFDGLDAVSCIYLEVRAAQIRELSWKLERVRHRVKFVAKNIDQGFYHLVASLSHAGLTGIDCCDVVVLHLRKEVTLTLDVFCEGSLKEGRSSFFASSFFSTSGSTTGSEDHQPQNDPTTAFVYGVSTTSISSS